MIHEPLLHEQVEEIKTYIESLRLDVRAVEGWAKWIVVLLVLQWFGVMLLLIGGVR